MNPEKWNKIKALFNEAVELDSARQQLFLDQQNDEEIIGEVRKLLAAEKQNNFDQPVAQLSQL